MTRWQRSLGWLSLFAAAMALTEAVVVIHLRALYYPDTPLALFPLRLLSESDLGLELAREAATLVMLLAVAVLAEQGLIRRFAAFLYLFGLWDLFYYLWLRVFLGWPARWDEWDVLFLIPWPWLGPWLAPAAIAVLFAGWGGWVLIGDRLGRLTAGATALLIAGSLAVLAAFLQPGWTLLAQAPEALQGYIPGEFRVEVFIAGYFLMTAGLFLTLRGDARRR
jgi:hypothetical protein